MYVHLGFGYLGIDGGDSCDGSMVPSNDKALWQTASPPMSTFATFGRPTNALWAFSQTLGGRHIFDAFTFSTVSKSIWLFSDTNEKCHSYLHFISTAGALVVVTV